MSVKSEWVALGELADQYKESAAKLKLAAKRVETRARRERSHRLFTLSQIMQRDADDLMKTSICLRGYNE